MHAESRLLARAVMPLLCLSACTPGGLTQVTPTIGSAMETVQAPAPEVLSIVPSAPITADPQKAADNYRELLKLQSTPHIRRETQRRLADLQVQMEDTRGDGGAAALREAVSLYQALLNSAPDDRNNDRVLYQLARAQQGLGEVDATLDTLQRLSREHPDSALAHDGRFRRAELLFLQARYAQAQTEYHAVMELGDRTSFFEQAQYKYGWSLYKQSNFDEAISTFLAILDRALPAEVDRDPQVALEGVDQVRKDLARDALRVVTLALTAQGGGRALNAHLARHETPRFHPMLYTALGRSLLEKHRYSDGAQAFAAFVEQHPDSPLSPAFQSDVIAAYDEGAFHEEVAREKARYTATYDPAAPYWNGQPASAAVLAQLRMHLEDLARHAHASAQAESDDARKRTYYLSAASHYQRIITLYPQDAALPQIGLLRGDALFDAGHSLMAAEQYDRIAQDHPAHGDAPRAAHAAVLAYQRHATEVPAVQRAQALRLTIDASLRLAEHFPAHAQVPAALARSAQDLYELGADDEAVAIAERVLHAMPSVEIELRRASWSVTGNAQLRQGRHPQAEAAFIEELRLTSTDSAHHIQVREQLAAAIYQQGAEARQRGDRQAAATHFLRVGQIAPQASSHAAAQYDGASMLIELEDWPAAATVLADFRQRFPQHALAADADKKLAAAYQRDGKPQLAAPVLARIAALPGESESTQREAAWQSASLFDEAGRTDEATRGYADYVQRYPSPLLRALQARERLATHARHRGDQADADRWLLALTDAHDRADAQEHSEPSRALAARASLALGRTHARRAQALRLSLPMERSLPARQAAVEQAIHWLDKAVGYGFADIGTAATFEIGEVYRHLGQALLTSERPPELSALEQSQYTLLLEEQALPFEERAIDTHETNLGRTDQGVHNEWVLRSAEALALIAPARFGKREQGETIYEPLH